MQLRLIQLTILGIIFFCCACTSPVQPTVEINANETTIYVGDDAGLSVNVLADEDVQFEWSSTSGSLSSSTTQSVIFTAPDDPGTVIVDLKVTSGNQVATDSITFEVIPIEVTVVTTPVVEELPTETPMPEPTTLLPTETLAPTVTVTSAATQIPSSVNCDNRAVARNVFKQLAGDLQFSFADAQNGDNFECQAVYDRVNTNEPLELAIKLEFQADNNEFAFFGMSSPSGADISSFGELCVWVFSEEPNQVFEIQLKDTEEIVAVAEVIHEVPNEWTLHCQQIDQFSLNNGDSINLESILDFSIGLNQGLGNVLIWLDDFELR